MEQNSKYVVIKDISENKNMSLMWTPALSVHGVMDEMRQIHTDYRDPVEERG